MIHYCARCGTSIAPGDGISVQGRLPITRKQLGVYRFLAEYIAREGIAPTLWDIANHFGYSSTSTVHEHLRNIERRGWISRGYNESRAITLLGPSDASVGPVVEEPQ